ncbi:putative ester cyclase [Kribbella voronezhensis]|uniref:Putative ester cyclase n=1 Tax=Kribbella voronezhensis TaxID=2512212 RepID=A0A4R7TA16_9ACTN|nr:nuclear transport factor 2 family protein [Kribbella voronezhensis]TDU88088.1 putative ester cyclase [Kribbella voronezhensis]
MDHETAEDFYRRYMERCNAHRFDELDEFVHQDVRINDEPAGLDQYAAGLRAMVAPFVDYRWQVLELLVDGDRLAARFNDTGVLRDGRKLETQEFAVYHLDDGKIAEVRGVWVKADTSVLNQLDDA